MDMDRAYTAKIAFRDVEADEYRDSIDIRMDYVSVPVVAKVFAAKQRTFVTGGLDFGYLVSAERDDGNGPTDIKKAFKDYDLSMLLGRRGGAQTPTRSDDRVAVHPGLAQREQPRRVTNL